MDWSNLAAELVRALRGARTQKQLSKKLGFKSNVLFAWESGRDMPSARRFFELTSAVGQDPSRALDRFRRIQLAHDPSTREGMTELLRQLAGNKALGELAHALERDRYAVGRWLRGQTEIPLPVFLQFVDVTTLSVIDFLECLVDPRELPSAKAQFERLEAARISAGQKPWSHAIVHMVELPSYAELREHEPGWFASRLGISISDERECLDLLVRMGRLRLECGKYSITEALTVDTRTDPDATRRLASFWMHLGAERALVPGRGRYGFNTFAVSRADLDRLSELQRRYFAELRGIVADSNPAEAVAVATFQLFPLFVDDEAPPPRRARSSS